MPIQGTDEPLPQFWIICDEKVPGRIEVPVDAGSDIVRPCDTSSGLALSTHNHRDLYVKHLTKASPVGLVDSSLRSVSITSTVATDRTTSDLDLKGLDAQSSETGLCYSGRSFQSEESGLEEEYFSTIEYFDAIFMKKLPKLKVLPNTLASAGPLARMASLDAPEAPHKEGAEARTFGRTCDTRKESIGKYMTFDLKRMISRFRQDVKSKPSKADNTSSSNSMSENAATMSAANSPKVLDTSSAVNEHNNIYPEKNAPKRSFVASKKDTSNIDFIFMVPR